MPPVPAAPPLPHRARAVIVGIEQYDAPGASEVDLASIARIPPLAGVVADAQRLALSLHEDLGLEGGAIDLWTSVPAAGALSLPPGARLRTFSRDAFENFLSGELANDPHGGLLMLFWIGHGVIDGDNRLRLLLPGSTVQRPRDYVAEDLCRMLVGQDFAHFAAQVLVFSACRVSAASAGIEGRLNVSQLPAIAPDPLRPVRQLRLFGCALGQSSQQAEHGGRLLAALRSGWAGAGRWPDFEALAIQAAERVAAETDDEQRPQVLGFDGSTLLSAQPTLATLLGGLTWTTQAFSNLAQRCLRRRDRRQAWADLTAILATLDDLTAEAGVAPLTEFVVRVMRKAGAASPAGLGRWVQRHASAQQLADIEARLAAEPALRVLQLWIEPPPLCEVRASLLDLDGASLPVDWDIHQGLAFDPAVPAALPNVLGLWLERALACAGLPLLLELFVPSSQMRAGLDGCRLEAGGDSYQLGPDLPALLRSLDRQKSPKKREAWRSKGARILERYATASVLLHWSAEPADADVIRAEFAEARAAGAVWLALAGPPDLAAAPAGCPFRHGLDTGVPSMLWVRGSAGALPTRQQLEDALATLLHGPADNLLLDLRGWRELHALALRGEPALLLDDPRRPPPWTQAFGRC